LNYLASQNNHVIREIDQLLPAIYRRMEQQSAKLNKAKLSITQEIILRVLATWEKATMSELSRVLGTTMGSTTVLVDRLLKEGLVTRAHSEEDRRVVFIHITESGQRLLAQCQEYRVNYLTECFSGLSDQDLLGIRDALQKMAAAMSFDTNRYQY
jgi:DNA-binding MarR family transcriptional regulator